MADKNLTCKDCGAEFIFNESEQAFYKEKGFENEPQRCPDCRRAKKQRGTTITKTAEEASVIGGNRQESSGSPF